MPDVTALEVIVEPDVAEEKPVVGVSVEMVGAWVVIDDAELEAVVGVSVDRDGDCDD